ncbi:Uma2 family endonuclease [Thermostichus vulcanus]|uniref:Uma2 family endonuclease n=1 Tax=Thermostichus vulcanus str. 'Rupite' TaxID=2813851 RepID=A0ABT0C6T4_THEVL|nr:Uma2 family endonuclease [Thermostichus vulcanus]MCJ2541486.1 Uma2 family endonuclease [Thermostichus vulcanus str. 'Rupite']
MVIAAVHSDQNQKTDPEIEDLFLTLPKTLEEYLANPIDKTEWVNDQIAEKSGQTLMHAKIQTRLLIRWSDYVETQQLGGMVLVEAPCQTRGRVRRPDVAYLSPDLIERFRDDVAILSQSHPLIGEIISPTDFGEDIFLKSQEYLGSGALEVWLVFPKSKHIFIQTQEQNLWLTEKETAKTQLVLPGFEIEVAELLS